VALDRGIAVHFPVVLIAALSVAIFPAPSAAAAGSAGASVERLKASAPRDGGSCTFAVPTLFAPGNWPPGCWRPYGEESPFNRALPIDPPLRGRSKRIVRRTLGWSKPQTLVVAHPEGNMSDYGHPVYYSRASDPVYTVRCTQWRERCEVEGDRLRIPPEARPASGGDSHMAVIDPVRGVEYDFWQVRKVPLSAGGGTITVSHGGRTRWGTGDADGLGSDATAAHFALGAGVIRAEEWATATANAEPINHALFISVRCTAGYSVYPAAPRATGTVCPRKRERQTAPPLGARLYLAMSEAEIDALVVPEWKKPILKAMASYGMIVGDTIGGSIHSFGVWAESDVQYRAFGDPGRYAELGSAWGVPSYGGAYVFDIASGVPWAQNLRVVRVCVSRGTC
jgi:hypothetical protein